MRERPRDRDRQILFHYFLYFFTFVIKRNTEIEVNEEKYEELPMEFDHDHIEHCNTEVSNILRTAWIWKHGITLKRCENNISCMDIYKLHMNLYANKFYCCLYINKL